MLVVVRRQGEEGSRKIPLHERAEKDTIEMPSSYSVEETDSGTKADFARVGAIGPDWEQEFADE